MTFNTVVIIALVITMIAVAGVMGLGIFSMTKGGEFNKKYGNRLMQARVWLQALALGLLVLAFYNADK